MQNLSRFVADESGAAAAEYALILAIIGRIGTAGATGHVIEFSGDAIVALDLATGKIRWHFQATAGDIGTTTCRVYDGSPCPGSSGPDADFGAGTVLALDVNGRGLLLAGQKSGIVFALDPASGKVIWQTRVGRGGSIGGVQFGLAAAGGVVRPWHRSLLDQLEQTGGEVAAPGG